MPRSYSPEEASLRIEGDQLYQQRARAALPLLVRQAEAARSIEYNELATELGMPNPRNLNYVLGAIGKSLRELSEQWRSEIPPIQCVVINKNTGLPGQGVGWFMDLPEAFKSLSKSRQREVIDAKLEDIFSYQRWPDVLQAFNLPYVPVNYGGPNQAAAGYGGAESDEHKALKLFVARSPSLLGLSASTLPGEIEYAIPSGDTLDVSFRSREAWVAAEVKSWRSPEADIVRGIYQCVKYLAVMRAVQTSENQERSARVVLVLGGRLPTSLVGLTNQLGVNVQDNIAPE